MNEIIRIDESNINQLIKIWESGIDIKKPFSRQIYLISASIAGLYFSDNINELLDKLKIGDKLKFIREPDNEYDELAILVKDEDNNKLGYVPREKNPILARLMDAGKLIYGTVKSIANYDDYLEVEMEIYLED